jgi:hypothetical protein
MNFPADIINVTIEDLRKNKYELPAFNQLSRLVKHARFSVRCPLLGRGHRELVCWMRLSTNDQTVPYVGQVDVNVLFFG